MKIALVKQEVYQDLYVIDSKVKDSKEILLSSMGRVGPIGLISELNADFIILKEEPEVETQFYKEVIPSVAEDLQLLKTTTLDKLPGQHFKRPGSSLPNGHFAQSCYDIDWSTYEIVISINISLPSSLIQRHPKTLFCYMVGEANLASDFPLFNYDVVLNQLARGKISKRLGVIDFPYTFLKGETLQTIFGNPLNPKKKRGIYSEINSSEHRPVSKIPEQFLPLSEKTGEPIILHRQLIEENLHALRNAKYYVKLGGRFTRGNGAAEAISMGTLVIMNADDIVHKELILPETNCKTETEIVQLVNRLNANQDEYDRLLVQQQKRLNKYFFDAPLESLKNCLSQKRKGKKPRKNIWQKIVGLSFERPSTA